MLKIGTRLKAADNSGAILVQIIGTFGGTKRKEIKVGDIVKVAVKKAKPDANITQHQQHRAVVVRVSKAYSRPDGSSIRFDDNAVVILEAETHNPVGTRIFGPVARELKKHGFDKITYLAPEVL